MIVFAYGVYKIVYQDKKYGYVFLLFSCLNHFHFLYLYLCLCFLDCTFFIFIKLLLLFLFFLFFC